MKIILLLTLPPLLLCAGAVILSRIPLPYPLNQHRDLFTAIGFGLLGLAYLVGLTVLLFRLVLNQSHQVDPAFTELGLTAKSHALFGRQYQGT
ncbi:MAG: hypothetical protein JXA37_12225, partial [Chloroflexia bacterium]|nr:hypothetical protein [Chloroflexia bacterium]